MTPQQKAVCDFFVYIPQYTGATASLNVAVCGSIILHHFAIWANFSEQPREGEKFVEATARTKMERYTDPTDAERDAMEKKRQARAALGVRTEPEEIDVDVETLFDE